MWINPSVGLGYEWPGVHRTIPILTWANCYPSPYSYKMPRPRLDERLGIRIKGPLCEYLTMSICWWDCLEENRRAWLVLAPIFEPVERKEVRICIGLCDDRCVGGKSGCSKRGMDAKPVTIACRTTSWSCSTSRQMHPAAKVGVVEFRVESGRECGLVDSGHYSKRRRSTPFICSVHS